MIYNNIKFYIVSDLTFTIPAEIKKYITVVTPQPTHLNQGTGIKLYIDKYLQTKYTLYIDSDCLCYDSLQSTFNAFNHKIVSAVGNLVYAEDWCGKEQAETVLKTFNLNKLTRFNGGMYYIKECKQAFEIFDKARALALQYDQLKFDRIHHNWINEEILMSIAMGLNNELAIPDIGLFMTDLYTDLHTSKLNILTGYRKVNNPQEGEIYHRNWYPAGQLQPAVIHFGSSNLYKYPYVSQHLLFKLKSKLRFTAVASVLVRLLVHFPFQIKYRLQKLIYTY
ncbi:MAG: hypothetical protein EOP43_01130 [Sphingobacteriaceae bacterium]|nr:MAG: hypothetical protein EOP43_01130 [Sphingobacteriaceae bacterium]